MKRLLLAALIGISANAFADDPPISDTQSSTNSSTLPDASTTQTSPESTQHKKRAHHEHTPSVTSDPNQGTTSPPQNPPPTNPDPNQPAPSQTQPQPSVS